MGAGGAIFNQGTLILSGVTLTANKAQGGYGTSGGVGGGGAGFNVGRVGGFGGDDGARGPGAGAGAGMGGAIFNMGATGITGSGVVMITNSTLTGNTAQGGEGSLAGGGSGYGGALFNLDGSATLNDVTIAGNTVAGGHSSEGDDGQADGGAVYNLAYGNNVTSGAAVSATLTLLPFPTRRLCNQPLRPSRGANGSSSGAGPTGCTEWSRSSTISRHRMKTGTSSSSIPAPAKCGLVPGATACFLKR